MALIEDAFVVYGGGRGFRAGFRSRRFGLPTEHFGEGDSAHGALLRAVAHMAKVKDSPGGAAALLRKVADEIEGAPQGGPEAEARAGALEDAAREVLSHREGQLPERGWLLDNVASRKALQALSDALIPAEEGSTHG